MKKDLNWHMNNNYQIRILHNDEIDYKQWDQCIHQSVNFRIYALGWYLDIMNPDWKGIVVGNYDYVMPLTPHKKYGISYLAQPLYAQQLGIFPVPTPDIQKQVLDLLHDSYRYIDIGVNSMNIIKDQRFKTDKKTNLILKLSDPYTKIKSNYANNTKRHLKKAHSIQISNNLSPYEYLALKAKYPGVEGDKTTLNLLKLLLNQTSSKGKLKIYGTYSPQNELCAACCFLMEEKRSVYINGVSDQIGKSHHAMFHLVDQFIQNYAQRIKWLDFEGSMVEGIARFYRGFGAGEEKYSRLKLNRLPLPLKLIKK